MTKKYTEDLIYLKILLNVGFVIMFMLTVMLK